VFVVAQSEGPRGADARFFIARRRLGVLAQLGCEAREGPIIGRARVADAQLGEGAGAPHAVIPTDVFVEKSADAEGRRTDFAIPDEETTRQATTGQGLEDSAVVVHEEREHVLIAGVETPRAIESGRRRLPLGMLLREP